MANRSWISCNPGFFVLPLLAPCSTTDISGVHAWQYFKVVFGELLHVFFSPPNEQIQPEIYHEYEIIIHFNNKH